MLIAIWSETAAMSKDHRFKLFYCYYFHFCFCFFGGKYTPAATLLNCQSLNIKYIHALKVILSVWDFLCIILLLCFMHQTKCHKNFWRRWITVRSTNRRVDCMAMTVHCDVEMVGGGNIVSKPKCIKRLCVWHNFFLLLDDCCGKK